MSIEEIGRSSWAVDGDGASLEALGESEAFLEFQQRLSQVARVDRSVLIVGERGTGKELVASRLHYLSKRWQEPLITLNCAVLAPSLLEAELFGHEAGAFTGAAKARRGRFEAADRGTLFLDEIGLLPMPVQEKILRVVEYGSFERVGSSAATRVDVRIVGATNADLLALVAQGKFKDDLLDRLSFEVLHLPPLRERHGDIPLLARHFAGKMASELGGKETPKFSRDAMDLLETHPWPGNIRELKNVVERAVYRSGGAMIREIDFNPFGSHCDTSALPSVGKTKKCSPSPIPAEGHSAFELGETSLRDAVVALEVQALRLALAKAQFHQAKAAKLLGLSYHQFRALYRRHQDRLSQSEAADLSE